MVTATIPVGRGPIAFGKFIGLAPAKFVGAPGFSNCHGQSEAALANQFGSMDAAAAALGFHNVKALQGANRTATMRLDKIDSLCPSV
jgi:hypothetical protein